MRTLITSKYQTTIPKAIRDAMNLSVRDTIEWKIENGKIVIIPSRKHFLRFRNTVKVGPGDIRTDIKSARRIRAERHQ